MAESETKQGYSVNVGCQNCGNANRLKIPRGTRVEEMECPTCGCKELAKKPFSSGYCVDMEDDD